ncbi:VWA domain-containing protein [Adhaeretor mobilis]|uniref:von Willebrand factor type A domain protein n=1 Tax=Adhaeretor mobilis TaxID=1930276 RepID=A0A517MU33_9BACT|nr:VWA domain-containing protein [Adhaeretor mobilis]QDS98372.1 von Willebrand factor type A domain protein [Adhaeretor mobilis]
MFEHSLTFDSPGYLLFLAVIPLMWWLGYRSLAGLGRWRRWAALTLRTLVALLIIFALADVQYQRRSDRLSVIYLLDQSLSIPGEQREAMLDYVKASLENNRNTARNDRYAVVVFGRDAEVEVPLVDVNIPIGRVESLLDPEYSDVGTAIQRAQAIFPHDAARRIVLVTDGNQNLGDAYREARAATDAGTSLWVVPVMIAPRSEVAVEKVDLPSGVRRGQPFEMRVVLSNDDQSTEGSGSGGKPVRGKLIITRSAGDRTEIVTEDTVEIPPGKRVFSISEKIDQPDFYTYTARFSPENTADDGMTQNNRATAFSHVRGKGHVLLIENWETPGGFDTMANRLREKDIEVTLRGSDRLFTSLAELQRYDAVILGNVSRSSGSDADNVASFSDDQIEMLVRNTRELGCGLVMIGGPDTYGAGGWNGTELEKAMPVDFQIKSAKVVPVGALVLMMHAGEMPDSNYWQKRISVESIKLLGNRDFCGMVQWNGSDQWLWGQSKGGLLRTGPNRKMMLARVDRMAIGDMPAFDGAMAMAAKGFAGLPPGEVSVKHMIIISDGDPTPPKNSTIQALIKQKAKVTTVAVRSHGALGSKTMQDIAKRTGGKYYAVSSAKALPKIYQKEARRVSRPLVYEPKPPVQPYEVTQHDILKGIDITTIPPIKGYVLTTIKENPLVEVILRAPKPEMEKNATVLASWTYGAGRSVALTTDAGALWTDEWTAWDGYDKLFSQAVRWAMRPTGDTGNYNVATDVRDGKTQIIVTALDAQEEFLNDQSMSATVVTPDRKPLPVRIEQTAPGRYVGEFDSEEAGSYLVVVNPGPGKAPIRTGVNIGYSAEYRDTETNLTLLESLADLQAGDGPVGELLEGGLNDVSTSSDDGSAPNPFRFDLPPAVANQSIWPWLVVLGSCLFWSDIFIRRVQLNLEWLKPVWLKVTNFVLRRQVEAPVPETMSRLRSRKQEVGKQIASRQASTRFEEPESEQAADKSATAASTGPQATEAVLKPAAAKPQAMGQDSKEDEGISYTERLLKAKKQVWRDRDQDKDNR